jgi:hypothetical protein
VRALVVYESMFGNTKHVAEAIAAGLESALPVAVTSVATAPESLDAGIGLLVVGGPTHAFGMTRTDTRRQAAAKATPVTVTRHGIREWLDRVEPGTSTIPSAAFDTKIKRPRLPGSAGRAAAKRLRRRGFFVVIPAETFYVAATEGPLLNGELERATDWGTEVGALIQPT